MIKNQLDRLAEQIAMLAQTVMHPPRTIRIKEFFPRENAVTVQFVNSEGDIGGASPPGVDGDHKFGLGYRGDVAEGMAPQPGDLGFLFYTGFQYKRGFVLLSHSTGGDEAFAYTPIRGNWSL